MGKGKKPVTRSETLRNKSKKKTPSVNKDKAWTGKLEGGKWKSYKYKKQTPKKHFSKKIDPKKAIKLM